MLAVLTRLWAQAHPTHPPTGGLSLQRLPRHCCTALGAPAERARQAGAAWAVLYAAIHLLDKVEDGELDALFQPAPEPGGPEKALFLTTPGELTPAVLTNLTTGLIFTTHTLLAGLETQDGIDPATAAGLRLTACRTALAIGAGQHHDLTLPAPDLTQCWQIASAKSGEFFALACGWGARLAGAAAGQVAAFERFGRLLGETIQIANDLTGLWPAGARPADLARSGARRNLAVAYAFQVLPAAGQAHLAGLLAAASSPTAPGPATPGPAAEQAARRLVIECGAHIYLLLEAEQRRLQAAAALHEAGLDEPWQERFLALLPRPLPPNPGETPGSGAAQ